MRYRVASRVRRVSRVIAAGVALVLLAGCGVGDDSRADPPIPLPSDSANTITIGLITKTNNNPYFQNLRMSAKLQAATHGAKLIALSGEYDGDNAGQVDAIERLMDVGVAGILITPNSSQGIVDAVAKARAAGIVVIALDTETDPATAVDATFATDNRRAGELQGRWIRGMLGDTPPRVVMLDGNPEGSVDRFRHRGFLDGFGAGANRAILAEEQTNGEESNARAIAERVLRRDMGVNAFYTVNEPAALGARAALDALGYGDEVLLASIDGSCDGVQRVKDGELGALVMQFPSIMAEEGVDAVVDFVETGLKPSGFHDTGAVLVTDQPVDGLDSEPTTWAAERCWG